MTEQEINSILSELKYYKQDYETLTRISKGIEDMGFVQDRPLDEYILHQFERNISLVALVDKMADQHKKYMKIPECKQMYENDLNKLINKLKKEG